MTVLHEGGPRPAKASAAAVGFFDGVHFGHRFLLENVKAAARANNLATMAVTFPEHPLAVLRPGSQPPLLSTTPERISLIGRQGIDFCAILDFTKPFAALSAEDFMRCYLVERLNVKVLVMGYDHSIGHDSDSSFERYRTIGARLGICVVRAAKYLPPSGMEISSSAIRGALLEGKVEQASAMLGYRYTLAGKVVEGRHVGTGLGFPTANVDAASSGKTIPKQGVYAAISHVGGVKYASVVNIGTRPTLHNGSDTTVEAFLEGFHGNIYGRDISVEFVSRLRDEICFPSLEALQRQISADSEAAKRVLAKFV